MRLDEADAEIGHLAPASPPNLRVPEATIQETGRLHHEIGRFRHKIGRVTQEIGHFYRKTGHHRRETDQARHPTGHHHHRLDGRSTQLRTLIRRLINVRRRYPFFALALIDPPLSSICSLV